MNNTNGSCLIFLLCILLTLSNYSWAQDSNSLVDGDPSEFNKIRSLELDSLKNGVWVHYEQGQKRRAKRLGNLTADALSFFEDSLGIELNMRLALLDSISWNKIRSAPYGLQGIQGENPSIAFMPANSKGIVYDTFYEMKDHVSDEIRKRAAATGYSWDKIARTKVELVLIHELGHLYHDASDVGKPSKWFEELMAGYFASLYLHYERSQMAEVWNLLVDAVKNGYDPDHHTLADFERLYGKVGGSDYVWYQANFEVKAAELAKNHGFRFLEDVAKMFSTNTGDMPPQKVVQELDAKYPGFKEWAETFK